MAERVNAKVNRSNRRLAIDAFSLIARQVSLAKNKEDVLRLFSVLQGEAAVSTVQNIV